MRNLGDGCVIAAAWSEGNVVVAFDGKSHIDLNLFDSSITRENLSLQFERKLLKTLRGFKKVAQA